MRQFQAACNEAGKPYVFVLGNHDYYRDLCKKAFPPTAETQTQAFGYFPPPIPPDFTQIPP